MLILTDEIRFVVRFNGALYTIKKFVNHADESDQPEGGDV
jgi:hypothetical protein